MSDLLPKAGEDHATTAGLIDDGDSALESVPVQRTVWRRAVVWLPALAVVATLLLGAYAAGERFYSPVSRIPTPPPYPLQQGLLGVNQPMLSELQSVMSTLPEAGDGPLELAGEIYELEFPRTLADRVFDERAETATIFTVKTAPGIGLRFLVLRGDQASTVFAVEASFTQRAAPSIEGVFLGLPARRGDVEGPFSILVAALEELLPEVDAASAEELSYDDFTVFGPFARGDREGLRERITAEPVLAHLVAALDAANADVSLAAFVFLVGAAPERGVINAIYISRLRLVQEPLWGSSQTSSLAHELAHAYVARALPGSRSILRSAATYLDEAHPRLFREVVGHLYERLNSRGRAEEGIAFITGAIAAGQTKTVAPARLLQNQGLLSISEPILKSDVELLIDLGLLPECMDPAGLGHDEPELSFTYYDSVQETCS